MPHPHLARRESSILVIVDFQEPFAKAMADRDDIAKRIATLTHVAHIVGMPVVVTEQSPEKLGPTVPELQSTLAELDLYDPISKTTFSCCASETFVQRVYDTGRDSLILAGMETHVCVQQTALEAMNLGYKVFIPGDAVTSRHRDDWTAALDKMRHAGAIVTTSEMTAYELLGAAGTPEFKAAMAYLKW